MTIEYNGLDYMSHSSTSFRPLTVARNNDSIFKWRSDIVPLYDATCHPKCHRSSGNGEYALAAEMLQIEVLAITDELIEFLNLFVCNGTGVDIVIDPILLEKLRLDFGWSNDWQPIHTLQSIEVKAPGVNGSFKTSQDSVRVSTRNVQPIIKLVIELRDLFVRVKEHLRNVIDEVIFAKIEKFIQTDVDLIIDKTISTGRILGSSHQKFALVHLLDVFEGLYYSFVRLHRLKTMRVINNSEFIVDMRDEINSLKRHQQISQVATALELSILEAELICGISQPQNLSSIAMRELWSNLVPAQDVLHVDTLALVNKNGCQLVSQENFNSELKFTQMHQGGRATYKTSFTNKTSCSS